MTAKFLLFNLAFAQIFFVASAKASDVRAPAAAVARTPSPKESLSLKEGVYAVVGKHEDDDSICVTGETYHVMWEGTADEPVLKISERLRFSDFNTGLKTDSQPYYKDHCVYKSSTQSSAQKVTAELFTNCDTENITDHTELLVKENALEYKLERKVSRKGKVVSAVAACSLKKIDKK